ncbi:hypothetical protein N7450_004210 [Penicillium hetheringtonii]|uniref:Uncharacterized protein n=1 Tax=Penicillium hetheringtonii TaxID=911720 RepID=A0AAD6DPL5_9EURO|nr:hypothetical protein N7450_004210 [Penicillium hetheringtonii]
MLLGSFVGANAVPYSCGHGGKALYLQSNEQQNSIISIPIGDDGKLYGGIATLTGGMGGDGINGMTGAPAAPDALSSQSSVFVIDDLVFAVNAGSNTLSMFRINRSDPTNLTMVGEPISVPGDFPVTVTASLKRKVACVGYTGAKSGVSCAEIMTEGLQHMTEVLNFELRQTTPPVGPTNTVAQVFFAENDTRLITTVKGNPSTNQTGFVSILPFKHSDSSLFEIRDTSKLTSWTTDRVFLKDKIIVENQKATCWAAYSSTRKSVFVTDAALNRLIEISTDGAKILSILNLANGDPGLTDLKAVGRFVYALSPGNEPANSTF